MTRTKLGDGPIDDSGWLGDLGMAGKLLLGLLLLVGGGAWFLLAVLDFGGK